MSDEPYQTNSDSRLTVNAGAWLRRNRIVLVVALLVAAGLTLGWNWLVAANLLTFAIAMIGCLFMFAVCMRGGKGDDTDE